MTRSVRPKSRSWWENTSRICSSLDMTRYFHSGGTGEFPKSNFILTSVFGCAEMETFCDRICGDRVSSAMTLNGERVIFCPESLVTTIGILYGEWLGSVTRQLFTKRPPGRATAGGSIRAHLPMSGGLARMEPSITSWNLDRCFTGQPHNTRAGSLGLLVP